MNNDGVAEAWRRGRHAKNKSMSTDGLNIYSYRTRIGYTAENGDKIAIDFTKVGGHFISVSTSNHVRHVKNYAFRTIKPPKV